jgi:hypothetical protein
MKGDEAAVDKKEWREIREMVGMKPELEEYSSGT